MTIHKANSLTEIEKAMKVCADDFYNQAFNNEEKIKHLAVKFHQNAEFYIAFVEKEIGGFIAYYCSAETAKAYISMIISKKQYQGKGIGSALIKHMIMDCRQKNLRTVSLEVAVSNGKAIQFYTNRGFVKEAQASSESDYYELTL